MVNLVKAIESTNKTDEKQMKFLKRQLRTNPSDINKLRQSTGDPEMMIAPIHPVIAETENIEILQHILAMKDVDVNKRALFRKTEVSIVFMAFLRKNMFQDLLELLLEHVQHPMIEVVKHSDLDIPLPSGLVEAVENDRLDVLKDFLRKADLLEGEAASFYGIKQIFSPFYCLVIAVTANKPETFKQLLELPNF